MENDKLVRTAAIVIIGVIAVPIMVNASITLGTAVYAGVYNTIAKIKFNNKIKKGLKDGSIVEIDGKFYEVEKQTVEEA